MIERSQEVPEPQITGEHPPGLENFPRIIHLNGNPTPEGLGHEADLFLKKSPHILKMAIEEGMDVMATWTNFGQQIHMERDLVTKLSRSMKRPRVLKATTAAATTALALMMVGGIIVYRHRHPKAEREPIERPSRKFAKDES